MSDDLIHSAKPMTLERQHLMTPGLALERLRAGNKRFLTQTMIDRDLLAQIATTSAGQFPFAAILSCIDTRVPAEIIFDQGIGDFFSIRIAGNFVNDDILGSMEFACKLSGAKLILVLGHTRCGAIHGALSGAKLGHLTGMLQNLKPAIGHIYIPEGTTPEVDSQEMELATEANILYTIQEIRSRSTVLNEMEQNGEIMVTGALYHVENGEVTFYG